MVNIFTRVAYWNEHLLSKNFSMLGSTISILIVILTSSPVNSVSVLRFQFIENWYTHLTTSAARISDNRWAEMLNPDANLEIRLEEVSLSASI